MLNIDSFCSIIRDNKIKFVDLRFTDIKGKEHHITLPSRQVNPDFFKNGKIFDGSSMIGWKQAYKSDMVLIPDLDSNYVIDPFCIDPTIILRCDIYDPYTMQYYDRDPRVIAKKSERFLCCSNIADSVMFGPEPEFFLFDDVRYATMMSGSHVFIDDIESSWNSDKIYCNGNKGHRPKVKGGYSPVPPVDSTQNVRSNMSIIMEKMGLIVEAHHHEVATSGQNEIAVRYNTLTKKADEVQIYKYVVHNVAKNFGKTATFMPKPILHDNGSGMHCNISLYKDNINIFSGDKYGSLSEIALFYIGGILKHAKALNAITNPTTNSYKRLVSGYEAPVFLTYSIGNRSSAVRIPLFRELNTCRIEIRFPDPSANPYLVFSALLMAGLDGIINRIIPGKPIERDLSHVSCQKYSCGFSYMSKSLDDALFFLSEDYQFLMLGDVFTKDFIDTYIMLLQKESDLVGSAPHPLEFELYYSV